MKNKTTVEILLDDSVKTNSLFQKIETIEINKSELFKYAIMMLEVPPHIKESDFDYLQSKIPSLEALFSDYIGFSENSIINLSRDDRIKKLVSEAVGIGIGLKYSTELLQTNPNKLKKIGVPAKGKYMDYSTIVDSKEYEIETKGTVSNSYISMKNDVLEKKRNPMQKKVYLKFGTITLLKNPNDKKRSKCVIVDDAPEDNKVKYNDTFLTQLWSYAVFLSYIIDSKYYNKYIKPLKSNKTRRVKINSNKFFGIYIIKKRRYYGECFDYRLISKTFNIINDNENKLESLYSPSVKEREITKFFIGIDEDIVNAINKKDKEYLNKYISDRFYVEEKGTTKFLDRDGILIIKSINHSDPQLENIFTEEEVKKRLGLSDNFFKRISHQCGAPCRSKEKKGKPCEIWTYRDHCHFHR